MCWPQENLISAGSRRDGAIVRNFNPELCLLLLGILGASEKMALVVAELLIAEGGAAVSRLRYSSVMHDLIIQ
jgi:hypothetical protein